MIDPAESEQMRALLEDLQPVESEIDAMNRIEAALTDISSYALKAATNAEALREQQDNYSAALLRRLDDIHATIKTIGWWACFAVLLLAAIKWHWGG